MQVYIQPMQKIWQKIDRMEWALFQDVINESSLIYPNIVVKIFLRLLV
jgi:hypothetical protein